MPWRLRDGMLRRRSRLLILAAPKQARRLARLRTRRATTTGDRGIMHARAPSRTVLAAKPTWYPTVTIRASSRGRSGSLYRHRRRDGDCRSGRVHAIAEPAARETGLGSNRSSRCCLSFFRCGRFVEATPPARGLAGFGARTMRRRAFACDGFGNLGAVALEAFPIEAVDAFIIGLARRHAFPLTIDVLDAAPNTMRGQRHTPLPLSDSVIRATQPSMALRLQRVAPDRAQRRR